MRGCVAGCGARWGVGAWPLFGVELRVEGGLWLGRCWFEGDGVAESDGLGGEVSGFSFGVAALFVVVDAEVAVALCGISDEVPEDDQDAVGDGDGCLVRSAAAGESSVAGGEETVVA